MIAALTFRAVWSMCLILQLNLWGSWGEVSRRSNLTSFTKWGAARQGEASRPPERDQGTSALGRGYPFRRVPVREIPGGKLIDVVGNHYVQTTLAQLHRPNERRFSCPRVSSISLTPKQIP